MIDIENLYRRQFEVWPQAASTYRDLSRCECRTVKVRGVELSVRHNPARIRSSAADLSEKAVASRPCFLCKSNRPSEQLSVDMGEYELLVNPYPVFDRHLTIPLKKHTPQQIAGRVGDMLEFAARLPGMTVFYNGPRSGASAPDHFHFQAVPSEQLPLWHDAANWPFCRTIVIGGEDAADVERRVEGVLLSLGKGKEPDVNICARYVGPTYETVVIPRAAHRPSCYGSAPGQALVSPASVEMAGVFVAPRREDLDYCLAPEHIIDIYAECGLPPEQACPVAEKVLSVGVVKARKLKVDFHGGYSSTVLENPEEVEFKAMPDGGISCNGAVCDGDIIFTSSESCDSFTLHDVMIGIGFHWQQHEDQSFHGNLEIRWIDGMLQAVNHVPLETYLRSVVSSEMNAGAPEEFLKAHAVISRSWVLAQIEPPLQLQPCPEPGSDDEIIKWYDHDAHKDFNVCADDHCQRYQGCTKASTPQVEEALKATRGQVLAFGENLCDARFSKCCGGTTELFSTCWQDVDPEYLASFHDPYCGRASKEVLSTVLNSYDLTTVGYYRWEVTYTAAELADIVRERTGEDFGNILAIEPLRRGPSGRIFKLRITGSKLTRVIGKELEIRRTLSHTHLYSSAFEVESSGFAGPEGPATWTFRGRGWGHGVGLCQIGAAVMASEGHTYQEILSFYFPGSRLVTLY